MRWRGSQEEDRGKMKNRKKGGEEAGKGRWVKRGGEGWRREEDGGIKGKECGRNNTVKDNMEEIIIEEQEEYYGAEVKIGGDQSVMDEEIEKGRRIKRTI